MPLQAIAYHQSLTHGNRGKFQRQRGPGVVVQLEASGRELPGKEVRHDDAGYASVPRSSRPNENAILLSAGDRIGLVHGVRELQRTEQGVENVLLIGTPFANVVSTNEVGTIELPVASGFLVNAFA